MNTDKNLHYPCSSVFICGSKRMPQKGKGIFGWLGRQVGYVSKAVKTEVPAPPTKLYQNKTVEEVPHPDDPNIKLRRTVIDEAIEEKKGKSER